MNILWDTMRVTKAFKVSVVLVKNILPRYNEKAAQGLYTLFLTIKITQEIYSM